MPNPIEGRSPHYNIPAPFNEVTEMYRQGIIGLNEAVHRWTLWQEEHPGATTQDPPLRSFTPPNPDPLLTPYAISLDTEFIDEPMTTPRRSVPYRAATAIDASGLPSGYDSWESYYETCVANANNSNSRGLSRIEDRLRECRDVLDRTYYFYDGAGYYLWSWERQRMIDERKAVTGKKKSLIYILKFIKKNHKTLKPTSDCWKWLYRAYCRIDTNRRNRPGLQRNNLPQFFTNICNKMLTTCPIVFSDDVNYLFCFQRDMCMYYAPALGITEFFEDNTVQVNAVPVWIPKERFEYLKQDGAFKEYKGEWYYRTCFVDVFNKNYTRKTTILNKELHALCPHCRNIFDKELVKYVPEIEDVACSDCTKKMENLPHTNETVWGGYHGHKFWKFLIRRTSGEWDMLPMGIEIEMHPRQSQIDPAEIAMKIYKEQRTINPAWHEIYFERDGSLADQGMECVSNPMTLGFAHDYWGKMLPVLRKYCLGWKVKKVNGQASNAYGIHLTTSRKYWTNYQLARFIKFIHNSHNAKFIWAIAQRDYCYNGNVLGTAKATALAQLGYHMHHKAQINFSGVRYTAVNVKQKLVEVRIFASTLNQESFLKNYEFMDAIWHWVRETAWSTKYEDFVTWVATRKNSHKRWANLLSYLNRPKFYYKSSRGTVTMDSPFTTLLTTIPVNTLILQANDSDDPNDTEDLDKCAL